MWVTNEYCASKMSHSTLCKHTVCSKASFWCTFLPSSVGGAGVHLSFRARVHSLWRKPFMNASSPKRDC